MLNITKVEYAVIFVAIVFMGLPIPAAFGAILLLVGVNRLSKELAK